MALKREMYEALKGILEAELEGETLDVETIQDLVDRGAGLYDEIAKNEADKKNEYV